MLAVLLDSSHGQCAYGPFDEDDRETAQDFVEFLTAEVDPAKVVHVEEVPRGTHWGSAMKELLAWYSQQERA